MLTLSFAIFLSATLYGGRIIYRMEANTLGAEVEASLARDAQTVQEFFSACAMDLRFMKSMPGLVDYVTPEPGLVKKTKYAEEMLLTFAESHPHYSRIRLIDSRGMERMSLDNETEERPHVVLGSLLLNKRETDYFVETTRLGRNGIYASFFATDQKTSGAQLQQTPPPVITLASPLVDAHGLKKGIIAVDIPVRGLLERLSKGTFFQNDLGELLIRQGTGQLLRQQSPYALAGMKGAVTLSDTESVPYISIEYLPGFRIWMGRQFSSSLFKGSMMKIEVVSVSILVTFFLTVLLLGFINVGHFWNVHNAQKAIIHSLANLSEWRDPETGSHLERTRNFSVLLARMLRKKPKFRRVITADFIAALSDAVPLHDIGKVGIRDDILLKSAALSREETVTMRSHVLIGRDIIQDIIDRFRLDSKFLIVSRNICYHHHERYEGSGYPEGLRGNDIPLEARIFAICDVYDALRARRPYKAGMSHEAAVETIIPERGRHFDPEVVDAFLECGDRFHEIFEANRLFDSTYGKLMNTRSKDALKIAWSEDLSVGDERIDSQHVEFIDRVNALFKAILAGEGRSEALREITFLHDYAVRHFRMEEWIMEQHHFPDIERHKREHEEFLRNLLIIRKDVKSADDIPSGLVVNVNAKVVNWIVDHVIRSDKTLGEYVRAQSRTEG